MEIGIGHIARRPRECEGAHPSKEVRTHDPAGEPGDRRPRDRQRAGRGGAALALATYGVDHMVVTKYRWTANTPRAHITNQRTMEVFRDLGVEDDAGRGRPHELMGDTVFCTSLAGDESAGSAPGAPTRPARRTTRGQPDAELRHPADAAGADHRGQRGGAGQPDPVRHRVLWLVQDDDGVTVRSATGSPATSTTSAPST